MKRTQVPRQVRSAVISLCKVYDKQKMNMGQSCPYTDEEDKQTELWTLMDKVISDARVHIGADIANSTVRLPLRKAVWQNILCGKDNPYEHFCLPTIYRDKFYDYRGAFIAEVAAGLGLWKCPKDDI